MDDLVLMLSICQGHDPDDPLSAPAAPDRFTSLPRVSLENLRVGFSEDFGGAPVDQGIRETFRSRIDHVRPHVKECRPVDLDQVSTGLLEVSLSDVRAIAQVEPFIYGVRLPYFFDGITHMDRVLQAGNIFDRVNQKLAEQDAVLLALAPLGPSSGVITTNAVVRSPADMANLRMRALDDAQIAMYQAGGTGGTIVPRGEVPADLQTGVIDGYLNSPFVPVMFGQTDFVKNFSDAGVIIPLRAVIVSKLWYDGCPRQIAPPSIKRLKSLMRSRAPRF